MICNHDHVHVNPSLITIKKTRLRKIEQIKKNLNKYNILKKITNYSEKKTKSEINTDQKTQKTHSLFGIMNAMDAWN